MLRDFSNHGNLQQREIVIVCILLWIIIFVGLKLASPWFMMLRSFGFTVTMQFLFKCIWQHMESTTHPEEQRHHHMTLALASLSRDDIAQRLKLNTFTHTDKVRGFQSDHNLNF